MYYLGIDIGASSVKMAVVDVSGAVLRVLRRAHKGSPLPCLGALLGELADAGDLPGECGRAVVTGSGADMLRAAVPAVLELEEVPALVKGVRALAPQAASVIGMGAQSGVFATGFAHGSAPEFAMNESCAAGTGSFFEDQMQRLGLPLESYSDLVARAQSVPRLSGRCSVFAKTDIIHRQ